MYRTYFGKEKNVYKHKQLFLLPFCCVGLVVLIRIRVTIRVMVRVRVKITAGGGGWHLWLWLWFGLVWNDDVCIRASPQCASTGQRHTGVR